MECKWLENLIFLALVGVVTNKLFLVPPLLVF